MNSGVRDNRRFPLDCIVSQLDLLVFNGVMSESVVNILNLSIP
jgi:hypothetical protein